MRKFFFHTVSVFFFVFLVATAWSTTASLTFSKPDRLEAWLSQSKLYDHFVDTAIAQSQKSAQTPQQGGSNDNGGLSLSDPGVQDAVKRSFTPQVLQNAVNTFLSANYDWLNGKTATPEFRIDLTGPKAALAANLGAYAQTRAAGLPRCTALPLAVEDFDALTATCLPAGITPAQAGQTVQQKLAASQDFLAQPVVTADTINKQASQEGVGQQSETSKPYYVKLAQLPKAYRLATNIPWIAALLAVLSGAGVVFLAVTRRRGLRRIGTLLVSAGIVILLLIFISQAVLSRLEHRLFTNDSVGQLQQSLVDFAHRAQASLARTDLWFGVGFMVAGIVIYLLLKFVRPAAPKQPEAGPPQPEPAASPKPKVPTLIQL